MATRTAKGTVKEKVSGTTLTLSSMSVTEGHCIIVLVGFKGTSSPTVAWGNRDLNRVNQVINSTLSFGAAIFYIRAVKNSDTRDLVATWSTATTGKVMAVLTLDAPHLFFESAQNTQNTASPTTTGAVSDLPVHDCFHVGLFVAEGPSSDTAPTLSSDWTAGQTDGTVGVPPISNTTIHEGYKVGRCIDAEEMDSTGSVTRDWCNTLCTFKPITTPVAIDFWGSELGVGDTVSYNDGAGTSTITSITNNLGNPLVKVTLANGYRFNAHTLELS